MPDEEDIAYARWLIRVSVWGGFDDAEDRATIISDLLLEAPDHDEAALRAFADAEIACKAAAERDWPNTTDCDRLDAVFDGLSAGGILGLHNAGYTMSDGHCDAAEVLAEAPPGRYRGYCFYHGQDIEGVLDGGSLLIAFDHVDGEVPERLRIGQAVEAAFREVGFATQWDGTTDRRIALPGFDWKRRATAQPKL